MITDKDLMVGNIIAPTKKLDYHYRITKISGVRIGKEKYNRCRITVYGDVEMVNKENVGKEFGREYSITYPEWWTFISGPNSLKKG